MSQTTEGSFNPAFHFLGLVQKAIADGITRHCVHPRCPEVYLVPSENMFYCPSPEMLSLEAMCRAAPFDLNVNPAPDWHPPSANEQDVQAGRMLIHRKTAPTTPGFFAKPLNELLWYATICASDGNLILGAQMNTPVRLMAIPDFSTLLHREHDPKVALYMYENNADIITICAKTGVPLPKVADFYNACSVIGLIEQDNIFNPVNYLPGLIAKAQTDKIVRQCSLPGATAIVIVPKEGKYYTELDMTGLGLLCAARLADMTIGTVDTNNTTEEIVQIGRTRVRRKKETPLPKGQGRALNDLLFRSALYASQGRLLANFSIDTLVQLTNQPDKVLLRESATIPAERYIFPLTAFMNTNKAMTLPEIAKATQQPLNKVIDFYNACLISGLLSTTN